MENFNNDKAQKLTDAFLKMFAGSQTKTGKKSGARAKRDAFYAKLAEGPGPNDIGIEVRMVIPFAGKSIGGDGKKPKTTMGFIVPMPGEDPIKGKKLFLMFKPTGMMRFMEMLIKNVFVISGACDPKEVEGNDIDVVSTHGFSNDVNSTGPWSQSQHAGPHGPDCLCDDDAPPDPDKAVN